MYSIHDECLRLALQILAHDNIKKHEIMLKVHLKKSCVNESKKSNFSRFQTARLIC